MAKRLQRTRPGRRSRASAPQTPRAAGATRAPGRPAGGSGDRTRQRILEKAIETFAELGFAGASLRDIARQARIRVSSVYHYFPSKEALYHAVQDRMQAELRELTMSVVNQGLDLGSLTREAVGRLFDFYLSRPAYVQLGYRTHIEAGGAVESSRRVVDRWLGLMEGLMKPAELQGTMKAVEPALFLLTVDGLLHWHLASDVYYRLFLGAGLDDAEAAGRVREHVIQMVLRSVGLDEPRDAKAPERSTT